MRSTLVLLLVACAASIVLSAVRSCHVAAAADFATVAEAVRSAYQPGDLIVVVPFHQATPRTLLGDLPLVELRDAEPEMLRLHERVILIVVDAIGAGDLVPAVEGLGAVTPLAAAGRVRAELITVSTPLHPTFELRERLAEGQVSVSYGGPEPVPCNQWHGSRWSCPRDADWNYVGSATLNLVDGPRACVWMHPANNDRELTITLPEVSGSRLLIGHGFVLSANGRAPVELDVRRGGVRLGGASVAARSGWQLTSVDLGATSGPVSLVVHTRDNSGAHFCANAWVVE